jgi:lipoprotein-anchoring transpeptidase ErfK/SrfK
MLSRRGFLKLSGAALLGVLFPAPAPAEAAALPPFQGRVLYTRMKVRAAPSFEGTQVGSLTFDNLVEIAAQVSGGVAADYNRTWYRLAGSGYVYSGGIQPVRTVLNEPVDAITPGGAVGEVTIPYADSSWGINRAPYPGPRLYYQSTHWVTAVVHDQRDGSAWYQCYDNLWQSHYYTRPEWIRIHTPQDLAPITPLIPEARKRIEIILDEQMLYAIEQDYLVQAWRVSSGQSGFVTPTGSFRTFHKRPTYHMTGGYDDASIFDLPGVPWDTYITESGIAIHGTFWHNDFGAPHSHGCINLPPDAARWVYRWTSPTVPPGEKVLLAPGSGTRVTIRQTQTTRSWREQP